MPPVDCVVANNLVQNTTGAAIGDMGQGTKIEGNIVNPIGSRHARHHDGRAR